jgi:glutamine---fructose-6-phosphate transaminase (isomerizing)
VDAVFYLPPVNDLLAPVLSAVPTQLIAYYAAVEHGHSVDKPRNLAKSVTVE